jgi:hypothetical protein
MRATQLLEKHITQNSGGTFALNVKDGKEIGIENPILFADLARSLAFTNKLIQRGEINPRDIVPSFSFKRAAPQLQPGG